MPACLPAHTHTYESFLLYAISRRLSFVFVFFFKLSVIRGFTLSVCRGSVACLLSICICLSFYIGLSVYIYLFFCLYLYLSTCLSIYLSTCLSVYLPVYLSTYLPIYSTLFSHLNNALTLSPNPTTSLLHCHSLSLWTPHHPLFFHLSKPSQCITLHSLNSIVFTHSSLSQFCSFHTWYHWRKVIISSG